MGTGGATGPGGRQGGRETVPKPLAPSGIAQLRQALRLHAHSASSSRSPPHGHVQRTAAPADRNHTSVCPIATSKTPCMSQCLKSHTFRSFHLHNPHFLTSRVWLWTRQASPVWGGRHLASARSPPAPGVRPRPLPCPTLPLSPTLRCEKGTVAGGSGIPGCLLVPRTAPEAARGPGPHPPG